MARRKGRSLTRKDVINAAIRCLDEYGDKNFGVNRVARELGIKPPSIYNHVNGNEDLYKAVAIEGWKHLLELYGPTPEGMSPIERFKEVCRSFRRMGQERPAYLAVTLNTPLDSVDPEVEEIFAAHMNVVREALAPFGLSEDDLGMAALHLRAVLHGHFAMERSTLFGEGDLDSLAFEWMLTTLIAGFRSLTE